MWVIMLSTSWGCYEDKGAKLKSLRRVFAAVTMLCVCVPALIPGRESWRMVSRM